MADHPTWGPYETAADLMKACTAAYDAESAVPLRQSAYRMLMAACEDSGVKIGTEDHRHITWLSKMELQTSVIFAGLIRRAYASGRQAAARSGRVVSGEGSGWISR